MQYRDLTFVSSNKRRLPANFLALWHKEILARLILEQKISRNPHQPVFHD